MLSILLSRPRNHYERARGRGHSAVEGVAHLASSTLWPYIYSRSRFHSTTAMSRSLSGVAIAVGKIRLTLARSDGEPNGENVPEIYSA